MSPACPRNICFTTVTLLTITLLMFEGDGLESHSLPESFQKSQIVIPQDFESREEMVSLLKYATTELTFVLDMEIYSQNGYYIILQKIILMNGNNKYYINYKILLNFHDPSINSSSTQHFLLVK